MANSATTETVPAARRSTLFGLLAILFWSTTIAFSRSLAEQLGMFTASAGVYILAGMIGMGIVALRRGEWKRMFSLPRAYLLGSGALFVIYTVVLYMAVGLAVTRVQVLVVGLINYLWPGLSLVFSIPILGRRARPLLPLGIALALGGVWLAMTSSSNLSFQDLLLDRGSLLPYGLALVAAVCWGLYSNLSRRWAAENDGGGVPLFLLVSGLLLGLLRLFNPEVSHWSWQAGLNLAYMALFPAMLAYVLWDTAVRKGEIILVASLSYLTPLLSTVISTLALNVRPGAALWLGAGLVIAGAVICRVSITDRAEG